MPDQIRVSYRAVLGHPGTFRLLAAAGLARLSMGMLGLALVLSVRQATGSFSTAGFAVGAFALTAGILAPLRGRIVDRIGRRSGLRLLVAAFTLAGAALLVLINTVHAPAALIVAAAALGASAPPISAATRTAWPDLVGRGARLSTALSLDAVTEDLLSLTGPALSGVLAATTRPDIALATTVALELLAVLLFNFWVPDAAGYRPPAGSSRPFHFQGAFAVLVTLVGVLIPLLTTGIGLGILEVAVPALALHTGGAAAAGWMVAALSAGSTLGGLAFGSRTWRSAPITRYRWLCFAVVVCFAPLPLMANWMPPWLLLLIAGLPIAPTLVTGYLLADALTPDGNKTEAATWISTANNSGVAAGAALVGVLITTLPLVAVFAIPALAALVGLTLTTIPRRDECCVQRSRRVARRHRCHQR